MNSKPILCLNLIKIIIFIYIFCVQISIKILRQVLELIINMNVRECMMRSLEFRRRVLKSILTSCASI
jgi:hypothetical protein